MPFHLYAVTYVQTNKVADELPRRRLCNRECPIYVWPSARKYQKHSRIANVSRQHGSMCVSRARQICKHPLFVLGGLSQIWLEKCSQAAYSLLSRLFVSCHFLLVPQFVLLGLFLIGGFLLGSHFAPLLNHHGTDLGDGLEVGVFLGNFSPFFHHEEKVSWNCPFGGIGILLGAGLLATFCYLSGLFGWHFDELVWMRVRKLLTANGVDEAQQYVSF